VAGTIIANQGRINIPSNHFLKEVRTMIRRRRAVSLVLTVGLFLSGFAFGPANSPLRAATAESLRPTGATVPGLTERPALGDHTLNSYRKSCRQTRPAAYRRAAYRNSRPAYYGQRRRNSKLRTALQIAAPAAIGAGVGAMIGGKKGAGVGALLGGGGGAVYALIKNR
jgi:hypothetical protein